MEKLPALRVITLFQEKLPALRVTLFMEELPTLRITLFMEELPTLRVMGLVLFFSWKTLYSKS